MNLFGEPTVLLRIKNVMAMIFVKRTLFRVASGKCHCGCFFQKTLYRTFLCHMQLPFGNNNSKKMSFWAIKSF